MIFPLNAALPYAKELLQVLSRGGVRNFFRKEHLGIAGVLPALAEWRITGKRPKGFMRWTGNTLFRNPAAFTLKAMPFAVPMAAYLGGQAGQGHSVSTAAGFLSSFIPASLGAVVAGAPGALVGAIAFGPKISRSVRNALQRHTASARYRQQFEFGRYEDTEVAYTMRQRAVHEMSGSLLNARHVLGREAALMHS